MTIMSPNIGFVIAIGSAIMGQSSEVTHVRSITEDLTYPARVAPLPDGGVYVTEPPLQRVLHYDASGVLVTDHVLAQGPLGIAVHDDGRVFISREDGAIGVYDNAFVLQGTVNPAPLSLLGPNDLAFDATTEELYAVDSAAQRVLVFFESALGTWTLDRSWGIGGSGMGQFSTPQSIALDTSLGHVLVTDADNFRVQVFDTDGVTLFRFGYRILYTRTGEVAWYARTEGAAVDACGNIYTTDALMGTLRVADSGGQEIDPNFLPLLRYGIGATQLRVPCDVAISDAGQMFVADTNNGAVKVYDVACTAAAVAAVVEAADGDRSSAYERTRLGDELRDKLRDQKQDRSRDPVVFPDNPAEIAAAMNAGEYVEALDLNGDDVLDIQDLELAVDHFGAGTVEDFLAGGGGVAAHPALAVPHILDIPNRCSRCHSMDGAPAGGMLAAMGQENLCQSCHSAGKIAGDAWIGPGDTEMNHPWGVPASDADPGPAADSDVALHLDAGRVRCGSCHEPHESSVGTCQVPSPIPGWELPVHIGSCVGGVADGEPCQSDAQCEMTFMRTQEDKVSLCGECHVQYEEWLHAGHSEEHGEAWVHYDWSMGNNWLCTGLGTPYAYCTGEGVGTAASPAAAPCTGVGTPMACCTGPGAGSTCTVSNAGCTGPGTPWACCSGTATGNCANNLSAAACTGVGVPMACCTGVGTGSCSSRESCRQCHSGNGFIDFAEDFPDGVVQGSRHHGTYRVADCLVCHATHGTDQGEDLLRVYDTVWLPTAQVLSGVGSSATCMACHNGRALPPVPNPPGVTTPHYLSGGVMLEGINGVINFDGTAYVLTSSQHTQLLASETLGCATCHMAAVPTTGPGAGKVGGHTFNIVDHETGFENVANSCNAAGCHSGLTTVNRAANGDYDGDGSGVPPLLPEGVQEETQGLLELLESALNVAGAFRLLLDPVTGLPTTDPNGTPTYPYWTSRMCSGGSRDGLGCTGTGAGTAPFNCPDGGACNASVPSGELATVEDAIWNWEYVDNSGDRGVKNTGYAIGLLQIAYKGVTNTAVPDAAYRYSPAP